MLQGKFWALGAITLWAGLCHGQPIDKITMGHTPESEMRRAMALVVDQAGEGARMELREGGDYGEQAIVAQAFRAPLGELRASVLMIAAERGKASYARYVIRRENLPAAIRLLQSRWPAHVKTGSDEAGVDDVFFVSQANAAWVHLGTGSEYFGEIVVTTHAKLEQLLAAQNRLDDWWPPIQEAITNSARGARQAR